MRYLILAVVTAGSVAMQVRLSFETIHMQRTLEHEVPFLLEPFTARFQGYLPHFSAYRGADEGKDGYSVLRREDRVIGVNGQLFTGMSNYLVALWKAQHGKRNTQSTGPFFITIARADGQVRDVNVGFAHCTCGIVSRLNAYFFWLVLPLGYISLGALTVALRPRSVLAWCFFALLLSLSQLRYWDEPFEGHFQFATPMAWAEAAYRVPAVAFRAFVRNGWALALLVAAMSWSRRLHPLQIAFAAALFLYTVLQTSLAVSWSESYFLMVPIHQLMDRYSTEGLLALLLLGTAAAWTSDHRLGALATAVTVLAIMAWYTATAPITRGSIASAWDGPWEFTPRIPAFHRTGGMIAGVSISAFLGFAMVLFGRTLSWQPFAAFVLALPLIVEVCRGFGNYRILFSPTLMHDWLPAASTCAALLLSAYWIVRRATTTPPAY